MRGVQEAEGGVRGVCGDVEFVVKVMLRRSIMSCSFVEVRTGVGGSGRANALFRLEVVTAAVPVVVVSADVL